MKQRFLFPLIFGVPAFLAAWFISLFMFGGTAGFLWIFVFGDNLWPESAGSLLTILFVLSFIVLWAALLFAAYTFGKKQELHGVLNARHLMAAAGALVLLLLLAVAHQWGVGNLGRKSDSVMCAEFCRSRGFAGSAIPPRDAGATTCSCIDEQGQEAVKVLLNDVIAGRSK